MSRKLEQSDRAMLHEVAENSLNAAFLAQFKQAAMLGMGMTIINQEAYEAVNRDLRPYRDSNELAAVASSLTFKFQDAKMNLAIIESNIKTHRHDARAASTQAILSELFLKIESDEDLEKSPWDPNNRWRLYQQSVDLAAKLMKDPNSKKAWRDIEQEISRSKAPDRRLKNWSRKLLDFARLPETLRRSAIESGKLSEPGDWLLVSGAVPLWQMTAIRNKQLPDRWSVRSQREAYLKKANQDFENARQIEDHRKKGVVLHEQLDIDAKAWTEEKVRQVIGDPADFSLGVLTTLAGVLTELSWVFDDSAKTFTASRRSKAESRESLIEYLSRELSTRPNRAMLAMTIMGETNRLVNDPKPNIIMHVRDQFVTALERWVLLADETDPHAQKKQRRIIEEHHPEEVEIFKTWFSFVDYLKPRERQQLMKDRITPYLFNNSPMPFDFMILGLAAELRKSFHKLSEVEQAKCQVGVSRFIKGWYHDNYEALHQSFIDELKADDQEEIAMVQEHQNALRTDFVIKDPIHQRFELLEAGLNKLAGR